MPAPHRLSATLSAGVLSLAAALGSAGCRDDPTPSAPGAATSAAPAATAAATAPPTASAAAPPPRRGPPGRHPVPTAAKTIELPTSAGASAYMSEPSPGRPRQPAVILAHESWGLDDPTRRSADRIAAQGYVVLAVDLYRGKVARDAGEAQELARGLPADRALADLGAAFRHLAVQPTVDPARIGAVGSGVGGGYVLELATREPNLRGVAVNYGRPVGDAAAIEKIRASFLGNFGDKDRTVPSSAVKAFEAAMKAAKKDVDVKRYDANGHGFMDPRNKAGYDEKAAADAWARIDAFLAEKLKGATPTPPPPPPSPTILPSASAPTQPSASPPPRP